MEEEGDFLRAQARKCRFLAERVNAPDVVRTLLEMARDYDARADKQTANEPPDPA